MWYALETTSIDLHVTFLFRILSHDSIQNWCKGEVSWKNVTLESPNW